MGTSFIPWITGAALACALLLALYIQFNDRRLHKLPSSIASLSERLTPERIRTDAADFASRPAKDIKDHLPERTGRRYIVVGGGGFLGGWIVQQLLERGEEPRNIRVLDLTTTPANYAVSDAIKQGLQFLKTDVTDRQAVDNAFNHPWEQTSQGITVFHTAANIRFYERHPIFLSRSARVNVQGVRNVIEASKKAGADAFIYTSSGSISVKPTRMLLWPWESEPKDFVRVINEQTPLPESHSDFFSNYAATKLTGEGIVRDADGSPIDGGKRKMRTGSIRPGNGVFGPRGDMLCGAYLVRKSNPTWIQTVMQSFSYVENCALAHLLYERRLLDLIEQEKTVSKRLPDIGGQMFIIADPGPVPTYGDAYLILQTLTKGECHFIFISPTLMFLLSKVVGFYYVNQYRLISYISSSSLLSFLQPVFTRLLPAVKGDIVNLQPSLFYLTSVHLIFDDSRARKSPENGGLGYQGVWTTYEGLYKTWKEYDSGVGTANARSDNAGFGLSFFKKSKAVSKSPTAAMNSIVTAGVDLPVVPVEFPV